MVERVLLVVDLQNDYFEGGKWPLEGTNAAAGNAARLIAAFRKAGDAVIHIRHESTRDPAPFFAKGSTGAEIHSSVAPKEGEAVITKNFPNSFRATGLDEVIRAHGAEQLVVAGAMSHMCIDATVRAAADLGHSCVVAHDACATRALDFAGRTILAEDVHAAFMAGLAFGYAALKSTDEIIGND